jgi:hypothetical protein
VGSVMHGIPGGVSSFAYKVVEGHVLRVPTPKGESLASTCLSWAKIVLGERGESPS